MLLRQWRLRRQDRCMMYMSLVCGLLGSSLLIYRGCEQPAKTPYQAEFKTGRFPLSVSANQDKAKGEVSDTSGADSGTKTVYVITSTTSRSAQPADMTRLAQTLRLASNIHWVIVQSSQKISTWLQDLVQYNRLNHTLITCPNSKPLDKREDSGANLKNCALSWLKKAQIGRGVIYFADDGNSYDFRIFDELRKTRTVGVLPVGLTSMTGVTTPIVQEGHVVAFMNPAQAGGVQFPIIWPGLAVDVSFWLKRGAPTLSSTKGTIQTNFLERMNATMSDLQPLANNCMEILVWQLRTLNVDGAKKAWLPKLAKFRNSTGTNVFELYRNVEYMIK